MPLKNNFTVASPGSTTGAVPPLTGGWNWPGATDPRPVGLAQRIVAVADVEGVRRTPHTGSVSMPLITGAATVARSRTHELRARYRQRARVDRDVGARVDADLVVPHGVAPRALPPDAVGAELRVVERPEPVAVVDRDVPLDDVALGLRDVVAHRRRGRTASRRCSPGRSMVSVLERPFTTVRASQAAICSGVRGVPGGSVAQGR